MSKRSPYKISHARVEEWAKAYKGKPFHALLCDPPYELGFMGKDWDKSGIVFKPDTWAALAEHLLPGAFGMAFASARGWHRLACAIEDAGLRIHPSIFMLGYCYGAGFPKATRVDLAIDKMKRGHPQGSADPDSPGHGKYRTQKTEGKRSSTDAGQGFGAGPGQFMQKQAQGQRQITDAEALVWAGHRYGLQALKPALEPIIVFQVPYDSKAVDSITRTGAGALNIEKSRIGVGQPRPLRESKAGKSKNAYGDGLNNSRCMGATTQGRWPANLILTCACDPTREDKAEHPNESCPVRRLDEQSGESKSGVAVNKNRNGKKGIGYGGYISKKGPNIGYADSGGSSRFFFNSDWNAEVEEGLLAADPAFYTGKASRRERDAGLEERNKHPTLKPIKLCRWLATLLLPPEAYAPRQLLVPFAGTGSEMIAAVQAGWEHVRGIECEEEYVEIAKVRLAYWSKRPVQKMLYKEKP